MPRLYNENKVDGIIVLGQMHGEYLKKIETVSVPIVFFDFYVNHSKTDCVVSDNFFSAIQLTNRLAALGHRSIAYVGSIRSTSSIQDRFLGCYKSLIENNIPLPASHVIEDRDEQGRFIPLVLPDPLPRRSSATATASPMRSSSHLEVRRRRGPRTGFRRRLRQFDLLHHLRTADHHRRQQRRGDGADLPPSIITKKIGDPERVYGRVMVSGTIIDRLSAQPVAR
ncbi:MAG: hypothetical protein MZW92_02785 [Comamonadaceae bacterium]|nr:hypothetical protein [Comamonadaceae bacterium]